MSTNLKYILVDDDDVGNWIYSVVIKEAVGNADVKTFTEPGEALEFIQKQYGKIEELAILFLDINMPGISGWEFLEQYEKFSDDVKRRIDIYILSSSIDVRDRNKAENNKNVKGFISKPLTIEVVDQLREAYFS
jgi:CheY-like chemotaxis protein